MKSKIIQGIVIVIGLYLVWISAKGLWDLRKAGRRLDESKERLIQVRGENQELKLRLDEVTSSGFIEKEAREKLGLQKPGEVVVILPTGGEIKELGIQEKEVVLQNWEKWWRLFFGE